MRGILHSTTSYTNLRRRTLAGQDAVASVGSKVDSYDNALTETLNTLYKAELIRNRGAWKGIDDVELAAAERVHWFNTYRPHRSTWCSDSLCVPIRLFQCAAAGCVARARADD
ncbi:integrase core domain-containing protein [Brevibacterium linens]|uniref:integrase core domain-containing protein n=1 Tax=Brevibacterium linens TaxID=1703 RepID=UPI0015E06965